MLSLPSYHQPPLNPAPVGERRIPAGWGLSPGRTGALSPEGRGHRLTDNLATSDQAASERGRVIKRNLSVRRQLSGENSSSVGRSRTWQLVCLFMSCTHDSDVPKSATFTILYFIPRFFFPLLDQPLVCNALVVCTDQESKHEDNQLNLRLFLRLLCKTLCCKSAWSRKLCIDPT